MGESFEEYKKRTRKEVKKQGGNIFERLGKEIKKFIKWCADLIKKIHKWFLTAMHNFKKWLGEVMSEPLGALAVILLVGLAIVLSPAIMAGIEFALEYTGISAMMLMIEESAGKVAVMLRLNEVLLAHDILLILWEDYSKMFTPFYRALSNLSADLGYGANFINLLVQNTRNVIASALVLVGLPPETIEMTAFDEVADFLTKTEEDFYKYAAEPEKLMRDVVRKITRPYYQLASEAQKTILTNIDENTNKIETTVTNFYNFKHSVDKLFADLPDDVERKIMGWYEPISTELEKIRIEKIDPLLSKMNDSVDLLNEHSDYIELNNLRLAELENQKFQVFMEQLALGNEIYEQDNYYFQALVAKAAVDIGKSVVKDMHIRNGLTKQFGLKPLEFGRQPTFLSYEKDVSTDVVESVPHKNWQVGDY